MISAEMHLAASCARLSHACKNKKYLAQARFKNHAISDYRAKKLSFKTHANLPLTEVRRNESQAT